MVLNDITDTDEVQLTCQLHTSLHDYGFLHVHNHSLLSVYGLAGRLNGS